MSEGDHFKLLMIKDNYNGPALDTASSSGNTWMVKYALDSTIRDQREEMLQMKDVFGRTPIHWAAAEGHKDVLLSAHDRLSGDEWFKVLQMKDTDGFSVVHHGGHHHISESHHT